MNAIPETETPEKKKRKLLEYNVTGQITDADFLKMNRQCDEEIEQCSRSLAELEEQQNSRADLNAHIAEIRRVLAATAEKENVLLFIATKTFFVLKSSWKANQLPNKKLGNNYYLKLLRMPNLVCAVFELS